MTWVYILFFFSGFPALIYQIVWQRALFAIYGINVESVTMVVSAFMLGLGVGSLCGGWVSERPGVPLLAVFGIAELGIATFGIFSLRLFDRVGLFTAGVPALQTGLITFLLVVIPTTLMGGTLPLLTAYLVRISGNVGQSVGILYFVNTLGSATACLVAAMVTMRLLGMTGSVAVAAAMNATTGGLVLIFYFRRRRSVLETTARPKYVEARAAGRLIPFPVGLLVVGVAGFISLSYEIVWYRLYAFITGGQAKSFGFLLGWFLAGIAFGSLLSRRLCREEGSAGKPAGHFVRVIAMLVLAANVLGFLVIPIVAQVVTHVSYLFTLPLIGVAAGLMGATFPLMCHVSVKPDARAGARLSYLYLSNIIGSAAGSLLVGFVLMDIWGIRQIAVMLALFGLALGVALLLSSGIRGPQKAMSAGAGALLAVGIIAGAGPLFHGVYDKLQNKKSYDPKKTFKYVVENKSGVVTVDDTDTVYGGGTYDGKFSTDLMHDQNNIYRPFAVSSFHAAPREVLMIGMASGSWAQVLANHPQVEKFTIVEITPGYLPLIAKYSNVASVLRNPKVDIVIDDGRRWLVRNPNRKFDLIVMNTSFHWRAHTSNLLSTDFLKLVRQHLKPGGVHFYNTTQSGEAQITGATVFPYALRVGSFLAVSDSPLLVDQERWRQILTQYRIDGKPVFDLSLPEHRRRLEEVLSLTDTVKTPSDRPLDMESADNIRRRQAGKRLITDDNMGTEWLR